MAAGHGHLKCIAFELPQFLGSLDLDSLLAALSQIFECGYGGLPLNKVLHALALILSLSLRMGGIQGQGSGNKCARWRVRQVVQASPIGETL